MDTKLIRNLEVFKDLSDEEWGDLAGLPVNRVWHPGEAIFFPGEAAGRVFILLAGRVKLYQIARGKRITLDICGPGELFGDLSFAAESFVGGEDYAESLEETTAWVIDAGEFVQLLRRTPSLAINLLLYFRQSLDQAKSRIRDLALSPAETRILNELVRFAAAHGVSRDDYYEIYVRLTHQDLADMTGLTRETVTKRFAKLVSLGLVNLNSHTHTLRLNKAGLRDVTGKV